MVSEEFVMFHSFVSLESRFQGCSVNRDIGSKVPGSVDRRDQVRTYTSAGCAVEWRWHIVFGMFGGAGGILRVGEEVTRNIPVF